MKCHYEVLGVERNVGDEDLKKAYRKLALKHHPDKNRDDPELAKEAFQLIQQAFELISDPQERAWYDNHREAILRGLDEDNREVDGIDLSAYFTPSCYSGYGKDENSFYMVYRNLFKKLEEEDETFHEDSEEELSYPSFGNMDSPDELWQEFYAFFSCYITTRTYSWLDKYDTRQADNRRVSRLMEKENKKVRDAAKKERSDVVRELMTFVRKRDKRLQEYAKKLEEKRELNAQKTAEKRKKQLEAQAKVLQDAFQQVDDGNGGFGMKDMEDELRVLEDRLDAEDDDELFCVACNKEMRSQKAFASHRKQKKHLENVEQLRETLIEEEFFNSEDLESDDSVAEVQISEDNCNNSDGSAVKENNEEVNITKNIEEQKHDDPPKRKPKSKKSKNTKLKDGNKKTSKAADDVNKDLGCVVCKKEFSSKNKLFNHLKETGHSVVLS